MSRLVRELVAARRVPSTFSADTPLLEREEEVAALAAAIARAARGEGALLVLEAQAGLGKSRLLDAAGALAADRGLRVLRGTGHPLERELAFGVALQLFEPALPARGPRRDALFEGAAGLARPLLDPDGAAPVAGGEPALLHGLYWLTSNLAEASPLALVVDDVHWADHSSLRFLAYLARRLDGLHVVLAAAQRPREPGAPGRLLAELRGHGAALSPQPLGEKAARRLVRLRFPTAAAGFVRAALELTGGNPFLLEELLRGFAERGEEPSEAAGAQLAQLAPESVLRSVSARVARLPPGAPALARAAAVMGSGAHLRIAGALAALDRDAARGAADALVDAELLAPGDPLAFAHPLLRSVVYDDIPAAERAAAHGRAARLLATDGAAVEEVAAHLLLAERAGEPWTVATLEAAAERSLADGAPDSAVAYLRRALEEPPHAAHRGALLHALGRAEAAAGRPEAVDHLSGAVTRIGDVRERALAAQDLARALHTESRYLEAAAVLDQALAELGDGHERLARELEAIWVSVARLALPLRQLAVERLAAIAARPSAETYAERLLLAQVSGQKVFAGDPREEACALAGAALAGGALLTEGGPDDQGWLIALGTFGWSDDYETCDRGIETCVEDARRRGLLRRYASAVYGRTMTGYYAGRLNEVVADNEQAIALRQGGWQEYLPAACAQLAWALIERDELDAAARTLSLAGLDAVENASQVLVIEARARLAARRGDLAGALELALESGRVAEAAYVTNPSCLQWRSTAAVAAAQLGDAERAEELVADELWRARRFGAPRPIGVALRASGLVAGGDTGTEMMREAVAVLEDSPARLEHARALVDLGAALRRTGHRAEARAPLREGLGLAERCGAVAIERRAREELKASGARARPRPRSGRDTLTPSELRVAEMAMSGMTNREIAQALFVTSKAVQFHLGNCYRKLGVAGRDELAVAIGLASGRG